MTFKDYFQTINNAKVFDCCREDVVILIFTYAGADVESKPINPETVKQWLKRNKPGKAVNYFKNNKINQQGFLDLFRNKTEYSWRKLQNEFVKLNDKGFVDCTTFDKENFYWCLLKQFLSFWGLEDDLKEYVPVSEKICNKYKQLVQDFNLYNFFNKDINNLFYNFFDNETYRQLNEDESNKIEKFIESVDKEIIEPFKSNYNGNYIYQKIIEINLNLDNFIKFTFMTSSDIFSTQNFIYEKMNQALRQIVTLYTDICGAEVKIELERKSIYEQEESPIMICREDRGFDNCLQCGEFPCKFYHNIAHDKEGGSFTSLTFNIENTVHAEVELQAYNAFDYMESQLEKNGLTLKSVYKIIVFLKNPSIIPTIQNVFNERFNDIYPERNITFTELNQEDSKNDLQIQIDVIVYMK